MAYSTLHPRSGRGRPGGCVTVVWIMLAGLLLSAAPPSPGPFLRGGFTLESKSLGMAPLRIEYRNGSWQATRVPPSLRVTAVEAAASGSPDPDLSEVRICLKDEGRPAVLSVLLSPDREGRPSPFLLRLTRDGSCTYEWNFIMTCGNVPREPDRARVASWVCEHVDSLDDSAFLMQVSDYFWHHQDQDSPPGSYNRVIRINLRILELEPDAAGLCGTTAWLLWSKWVSWKLQPESMPDGATALDRALALLARGVQAHPQDPRFLLEAGTVLMPLVRRHRPDLAPLMENYLRQAAEAARSGRIAVRAWRTYAGILLQQRRYSEAARWYRRVLEIDPGNEIARRQLARIAREQSSAGPDPGESAAPAAP